MPEYDGTEVVRWGGYEGRQWRDLPESYLYFIANKLNGPLGDGARREVDRRRALQRMAPVDWSKRKN